MAGKECRGWAEREWRWRAWIWPFVPLQSQISALAWLEHRSTGHVSARTLLRDRCFPRLPTASQEEQELQTSQGSVDELAGMEQGSCHHGGFAGPLGSRATSVQKVPFPARRNRDSCGGREGGRGLLISAGIAAPGGEKDVPSPLLPPRIDFFLSETSWDLAEGAGESPVPPQLSKGTWAASSGTSLMALTGVEKLKEHLRTRLGLGLSLPRLLAPQGRRPRSRERPAREVSERWTRHSERSQTETCPRWAVRGARGRCRL